MSSNNQKKSQSKRVERDRQLLAGLAKHFGKNEVLVVNGEKTKCSELLAMLEERIRVAEPVAPAKRAWMACAAEQERVVSATDESVTGLVDYLRLVHAASPTTLSDFGLAPKKKPRRRRARASEQQPAPAPAPAPAPTGSAHPQ